MESTMTATEQQEWPDRTLNILVPSTTLCVLSTAIFIWRLVYRIKAKRKLMLSDYLLVIATILNIATTCIRYRTVHHGLGRHMADPSIKKPYDIIQYMYFLWIGQIMNIIAVGVLKYSICAYLLVLKFSRVYLSVVWASILMVTVFNMILPVMGCFCSTPLESNWNKTVPGKCFMKGGTGLTYSQGIANIITDVIYVVAPIIYLSSIQLPKRTQWGLRIVFCLGLAATACSVAKTIELSTLMRTVDPMWDGTNLSIWSASELSVGVIIASLPPLRKQFDTIFRNVLSSMGIKSKTQTNDIPLYNASKQFTIGSGPKRDRPRLHEDDIDDGESEKHILDGSMQSDKGEITRTIVHEVHSDDRNRAPVPQRTSNMYE